MEKDPVCGMRIADNQARHSALYMGENYFFCSEDCRTKFAHNPEKYVDNQQKDPLKTRKVVVVGAGQVGAAICFALTMSSFAATIVLVDLDADLAEGHAMDLNHGLSFVQPKTALFGSPRSADELCKTSAHFFDHK